LLTFAPLLVTKQSLEKAMKEQETGLFNMDEMELDDARKPLVEDV
jgi:hypothetical protein